MNLLLKDARPDVAEILNMHVNDPRVDAYINEAIQVIIQTHDWVNMERLMSFVAYNGAVTFPPEVIQPIHFNVMGYNGRPMGMQYEYLSVGPGASADWAYTAKNLVDAGYVPTAYDVDKENPTQLAIWSDETEDVPFSVWIRGLDENGKEVRSAGEIGETITWSGPDEQGTAEDQVKLTTAKFSRILQIVKPASKGYINITTVDTSGLPDRAVSSLHPDETSPSYRRFTLHGIPPSDSDGFSLIKGVFRIGYTKAVRDNDPLLINVLHAVKLMVKSVYLQEKGEPNKAAVLEGQVERILTNQKNAHAVDDGLVDRDDSHDMSDLEL